VLAARNGEALAEIQAEIERHGGAAIHVVTDVSDRAQVEAGRSPVRYRWKHR
jgi:NADP-dependent 3-hydroxy acid dehydrogenase YdfG